MVGTIIVVGLIFGYSFWVIRRKVHQIKQGNYCGCGCEDCGQKCSMKK